MTFTLLDLQLHSYAIFLPSRAVTAIEIEMRSRSRVSLLSYVYVRKYVQKIKDTLFFLLPAKKHTKPTTARKSVSENN